MPERHRGDRGARRQHPGPGRRGLLRQVRGGPPIHRRQALQALTVAAAEGGKQSWGREDSDRRQAATKLLQLLLIEGMPEQKRFEFKSFYFSSKLKTCTRSSKRNVGKDALGKSATLEQRGVRRRDCVYIL